MNLRSFATKILAAILLITLGISLFSLLFEKYIFYAHLFVHFQFQYFVIVLICSLALFLFKKKYQSILGFFYCGVLYFFYLHRIILFPTIPDNVDIVFLNSQYDSTHVESTFEVIQEINPQIVGLVESSPLLVEKITAVKNEPVLNHRAYASSCTIFSENPVKEQKILGKNHLPICIVSFETFDLITVHPHRPMNREILAENLVFFDELHKIIQDYEEAGRKFIVVGDFNSTYYSSYFRERFGQYDQKIFSTWMVGTPLSLPIDHVLTNIKVQVARSSPVGSDHRALLVDILE